MARQNRYGETMTNQLNLQQRHAVVTGAASGLGFAIANRLLASGARLTLWDRDPKGLEQAARSLQSSAAGSVVNTFTVDVASHASVAEAARHTQAIAPVDILVVPGMRERNYGRIVNIASVAGKEGNPNASAYSASKAAVIGLTKSLGKELADTGICVNCVTPAAVKTAILDQNSAEHIAYMLSKIPMGRFGTPEEIAAMVAWLCTEECSFTTGAVFDLSGGRATY